MKEVYRSDPLEVVDGVPIFVDRAGDKYIANYDRISEDHLSSIDLGQGNPFIEEEIWNDIERNVVQLIRGIINGGNILDVGVGTGRLLAKFPNLRRYGVDISLGYLKRLADSGIEPCLANLELLPYIDQFFDVVVCTDVLEHVIDLHAAVLEMKRVLKPGGLLIIRVPYREDLSQYLSPSNPYHLVHVRNFDEHKLLILFGRVYGFIPIEHRFDAGMLPSKLRIPLPRGKQFVTRILSRLSRRWTRLRPLFLSLYAPIDITMVFQKPT